MERRYLTLREALATDQLETFVRQDLALTVATYDILKSHDTAVILRLLAQA